MVTARVPVRTNRDDRTDAYQAMPRGGFTRMFERMLAHPKISILLNTDYRDVEGTIGYDEVVFTDPYYPIPRAKNAALYRKYQELASRTPGVHFVGRLGTYKYYNMDQVGAGAHDVREDRRSEPHECIGT